MTEYVQVQTTADDRAVAERLARGLVEARAAACAQVVGPIRSFYWWKGALEEADEWLVLAKTRADVLEQVEAVVGQLHTYELPELIATPVVGGKAEYLEWVREETRG